MSTTKKIAGAALAAALGVTALSACGGGDAKDKTAGTSDAPKSKTVTLVSHDSFNVTDAVLKEFEQQSGYTVKVLKSGDAGAALNQEILTKGSPAATSSSASTTPSSRAPSTTASSPRTRPRAWPT